MDAIEIIYYMLLLLQYVFIAVEKNGVNSSKAFHRFVSVETEKRVFLLVTSNTVCSSLSSVPATRPALILLTQLLLCFTTYMPWLSSTRTPGQVAAISVAATAWEKKNTLAALCVFCFVVRLPRKRFECF